MSSGRRSDVEIKIESSSEKGNSIISRIYIKRKEEEKCESSVPKKKNLELNAWKRIDFIKNTSFKKLTNWIISFNYSEFIGIYAYFDP